MKLILATTLLMMFASSNATNALGESPADSSAGTSVKAKPVSNKQIDYAKFLQLTVANESVREAHRVSVKRFVHMATDPNTIILDTRSKKAFDEIHVRGAVHVNFSDFTDERLAKVIPNQSTRILIYCNNNFLPNRLKSLMLKRAPLALNIPTFVHLRGYGYENVFELADVVALDDPHLKMAGSFISQRRSAEERATEQR